MTDSWKQEIIDLKRKFGSPIAKTILRSLLQSPKPVECLEKLTGKLAEVVRVIIPTETMFSQPAKEVILGSTMALGSSFVLWGSMTMAGQPWIPAIGSFLGSLGFIKLFQGIRHIKDARERFTFLRTYFTCLLALAKADQHFSDQERRQLDAILASLDLTPEEKSDLVDTPCLPVEEIVFPATLTMDQKRVILGGGYTLLYCDGVTIEEMGAFNQLARLCGISGEELESLITTATQAIDEQDELITTVGAIGEVLIPEKFRSVAQDVLLMLASKRESKNSLIRAIRSCIEGDNKGHCELANHRHLDTALMAAWFLGKVMVEPDPDALNALNGKFQLICQEVDRANEGELFREKAELFYENLIVELCTQHQLSRKEKGEK